MIKKITAEKRYELIELFKDCKYDKVLIDTMLEGKAGESYAIVKEDKIIAARMDIGSFTIIAGDANDKEVDELLDKRSIYVITPQNEQWKVKLKDYFGDKANEIDFVEFRNNELQISHLENLTKNYPMDLK